MKPNAPVYPSEARIIGNASYAPVSGITIRDHIAIQMAAAVIQARLIPTREKDHPTFVAETAYCFADALITHSNKE